MIIDPDHPFQYSKPVQMGIFNMACGLLIKEYQDLTASTYDLTDKNENKIRDDLVKGANRLKQQDPTASNVPFQIISERPDLEENSRIDINIITPSSLLDNLDTALTMECKIVGEHEYINRNGIVSFTTAKYAAGMDVAGMVGFITQGDISQKIDGIKRRLSAHRGIRTVRNLERIEVLAGFDQSYDSEHERDNLENITLHHLFFDFA